MKTTKRTIDDISLAALYEKHGSVHRVGEELGVDGETVRSWLKRSGIKIREAAWTAEDDCRVREHYTNPDKSQFNLKNLAKALGRSYYAVSIHAGRIGLSDPRRKTGARRFTGDQKELPWGRWVKHPHPRGMLGKKHMAEIKEVMSVRSKATWKRMRDTGTGNMAPARRQARSDVMLARNLNDPRMRAGYSRCKAGRRADIGNQYFRSAWEANYARYLNWLVKQKKIASWEYECETFYFESIRRGTRSYTPDFKIVGIDGSTWFEEVKGWMDQKSRTKLKRMKKYYPAVRLDLIDQKRYGAIARTASAFVPGWEK